MLAQMHVAASASCILLLYVDVIALQCTGIAMLKVQSLQAAQVTLSTMDYFDHGHTCTLWLKVGPLPPDNYTELIFNVTVYHAARASVAVRIIELHASNVRKPGHLCHRKYVA